MVADLFRRASGRMVASLARRFGPQYLGLAEEAVQEALMRALQTWSFHGVPDKPEAWLFRVAVNRALDALRRETNAREKNNELLLGSDLMAAPHDFANDNVDDELAMIFMCCHPALPHASRLALTLKTVGGLSVEEIAAAFLSEPATIAQRLVRAKKQIRDQRLPLDVPRTDELAERLASVLDVLYLLFNEGYSAHGGDNLIRADLCAEAIRLTRLLLASPKTGQTQVHALLALMLFQAARLPARVGEGGDLLLLADQDRARWDDAMTAQAFGHFEKSMSGVKTAFHVEAAIASVHAAASSPAATDWPAIRDFYDELVVLKPSPVTALNRAVAIGMAEGAGQCLAALQPLLTEPALAEYHLLASAMAAMWAQAGNTAKAAHFYREALRKPCSAPERRFLQRQLQRVAAHHTGRE